MIRLTSRTTASAPWPVSPAVPGPRTRAQLLEQRNILRKAAAELLDKAKGEKRTLSDDEKQAFDVVHDALRQIGRELDHEDANRGGNPLDGRGGRGTIIRDKHGVEHRLLGKNDRLATGQRDPESAAEEVGLGGIVRALVIGPQTDPERRALDESPMTAGGFAVPQVIAEQVIDKLRPMNALVRAGAMMVTLEAAQTTFALWANDPTMTWLSGGGVPITPDSSASIGAVTFDARMVMGIVQIGRNLIEDAANLESALTRAIALEARRSRIKATRHE